MATVTKIAIHQPFGLSARYFARISARGLISTRLLSTTTSAKDRGECYLEHLKDQNAGITLLTLDRPVAKNAISRKLLSELEQAIESIRFESGTIPQTRVLIVRSKVDGVFCAGADLKERELMSKIEVSQFLHKLRTTFAELETLPMPTIAAIDGAALGGGLELALSCDLRVAGPSAKLGLPETRLAIIPGAGGTQRLSRLLGPALAKELIFTSRRLSAQEAKDLYIVNHVADENESMTSTEVGTDFSPAVCKSIALAQEILPNGPLAIQMAKLAIDRGLQLDLSSGLDFELSCYERIIPSQDRLEGLNAFKEKRKPVYKGL